MTDITPIIQPIDRDLLISELTKDKLLRLSNYGNNEIYVFSHKESPNLMKEVGRLRELSFRAAGGGTGKEIDIDIYDTAENPYLQLIVWDPEDLEIIGGYRFISGRPTLDSPETKLATAHLFNFSDEFINDYLPYTIELGRSFVQPRYQNGTNTRKGVFALDNLWDGLGALVVEYPNIKYFFGKVTMYGHFDLTARNYILSFLHIYFPDNRKLITPKHPLDFDFENSKKPFIQNDYDADYKLLNNLLKERNERIPALISAYISLSKDCLTFGTAINDHFGHVEETGLLIEISKINEQKKDRYINTYNKVINLEHLFPSKIK